MILLCEKVAYDAQVQGYSGSEPRVAIAVRVHLSYCNRNRIQVFKGS
jgi:hypothetical protein